jgi:proteic killer suppression protein
MISTFKCSNTEALFNGKRVTRFVNIQAVALRKLAMLNRAEKPEDLRMLPLRGRPCLRR